VGHHAPPIADLERMNHGDTLDRIRAAKPDILLVAFGNPKQEKWIRMHARRLGVPVSIGIGGSLDILTGNVQRAPEWMQRTGLEWLGRCLQEPTRLLPRYLRNFCGLASRLPLTLVAGLIQRPVAKPSQLTCTSDNGITHLHIQGNLDGNTALASLGRTVAECIAGGQLLVVHLWGLKYANAKGLGALLDARRRMLAAGLSLTLAGVPARIRMLLFAWSLQPLFDEFQLAGEHVAIGVRAGRTTSFANLVQKETPVPVRSES
jgi:N-acetylglucosaminyldiphosphoundecaprenol N-acetyl-beta-D-mannosaminyltransferase